MNFQKGPYLIIFSVIVLFSNCKNQLPIAQEETREDKVDALKDDLKENFKGSIWLNVNNGDSIWFHTSGNSFFIYDQPFYFTYDLDINPIDLKLAAIGVNKLLCDTIKTGQTESIDCSNHLGFNEHSVIGLKEDLREITLGSFENSNEQTVLKKIGARYR